jgi:hypothetical protein
MGMRIALSRRSLLFLRHAQVVDSLATMAPIRHCKLSAIWQGHDDHDEKNLHGFTRAGCAGATERSNLELLLLTMAHITQVEEKPTK